MAQDEGRQWPIQSMRSVDGAQITADFFIFDEDVVQQPIFEKLHGLVAQTMIGAHFELFDQVVQLADQFGMKAPVLLQSREAVFTHDIFFVGEVFTRVLLHFTQGFAQHGGPLPGETRRQQVVQLLYELLVIFVDFFDSNGEITVPLYGFHCDVFIVTFSF